MGTISITVNNAKEGMYQIIIEQNTEEDAERVYDKLEDAYLGILMERDMKGLDIHYSEK